MQPSDSGIVGTTDEIQEVNPMPLLAALILAGMVGMTAGVAVGQHSNPESGGSVPQQQQVIEHAN
jgi:hypothetical protein